MYLRAAAVSVFILSWVLFLASASAQSGSSVDTTPATPAHSGKAAGSSAPKPSSPPPPAREATNPVNNDKNYKKETLTGLVSDSYCGRHHYMLTGANDTECARYCIAHQGSYVLIVGDKIYRLENQPGHVLDSLAGKKARVTGVLVGENVLEVDSVSPAEIQSR